MNQNKKFNFSKLIFLMVILILLFLLSSCFSNSNVPASPTSPAPVNESLIKPQPQVANVTASTIGFFEDYQVILEVTIKNNGAEGSVIVIAKLTQAGTTATKQLPISLSKGGTQTIHFVFPLKWEGGEWVPEVTCKLP